MKLMPIGRFSRVTRLSVKALRLYDSIGLLRPERTDPVTGYRYYSLAQAARAERIRLLRSIEMPLDGIQQVLSADTQEEAASLLAAHKELLVARLATHRAMVERAEALLLRQPAPAAGEVRVEERPQLQVAAVRVHVTADTVAREVGRAFSALRRALEERQAETTGPPMLISHDVIDDESDGDLEVAAPVAAPFDATGEVVGRSLESCTVASVEHQGPFAEVAPAYQRLAEWVSEHDLDITGPTREVYLTDPQQVAPEQLRSRVEFPVA